MQPQNQPEISSPTPPASLPDYVADGLEARTDAELREVRAWIDELLAFREQPVEDIVPDDAEPVDADDGGQGTLVTETVTCGDESCHCMDGEEHGPYVYRYYWDDGTFTSEYVGKPDE